VEVDDENLRRDVLKTLTNEDVLALRQSDLIQEVLGFIGLVRIRRQPVAKAGAQPIQPDSPLRQLVLVDAELVLPVIRLNGTILVGREIAGKIGPEPRNDGSGSCRRDACRP
jgi:hypothetical protein